MPATTENEFVEALRSLMEEWTSRLAEVIEAMTQERPGTEWTLDGAPPEAPAFLCWEQTLDLAPGAALYVAAPEPAWTEIGRRALVAAGIDDADPGTIRSTYLEILSQAVSGLLRGLGVRAGREIAAGNSMELPGLPEAARWHSGELRFRDSGPFFLFLGLNPALEAALNSAVAKPVRTAPPDTSAGNSPCQPAESKTLDLLLDVEMPVSVSFGRAELLLKDVLKLSTGSIVELNRTISEPVDVVVNNCVIARGEVVVIEGNYGVRISQIISRQDRLRTLK